MIWLPDVILQLKIVYTFTGPKCGLLRGVPLLDTSMNHRVTNQIAQITVLNSLTQLVFYFGCIPSLKLIGASMLMMKCVGLN